ncbi:hypothetical protein ACFWMQ_25720 [Streptomyces sp. NPDC058372]|uniref:hypothetical protein n=1 Tax=Streptomyces sp. NPDC058372 TaxID=3346464 RepID=UPI0036534FBF
MPAAPPPPSVPLPEATREALTQPFTAADGRLRLTVRSLRVTEPNPRLYEAAFHLVAHRPGLPDEEWRFTLGYDKSEAGLFERDAPDPAALAMLVHLTHALTEEWWLTKSGSHRSARMGRRVR